jgi:hypothetical protein
MKILLACALAASTLPVTCLPSSAEAAQDFTLHNGLKISITHMYAAESGTAKWGRDLTGGDVLDAGDFTKVTFNGYEDSRCAFDIRIVTQDEESWLINNIDLCASNDLTLTMKGKAMVYARQ